jgi:hypothetical protein
VIKQEGGLFPQSAGDSDQFVHLHFVWIHPYLAVVDSTNDNKFARARSTADEWMQILPRGKYKLKFWTDVEIRSEFPDLVPVLSKVSTPAWISDVLRYHVMLRYGGVYLDTDVKAVHDFTPLLDMFNSSFTVCQTPWISQDDWSVDLRGDKTGASCESVINAIIAAPANHPVMKCAAERSWLHSESSVSNGGAGSYLLDGTGPACLTACIRDFSQITVLPSWTFLACSFFSRETAGCSPHVFYDFPNVYGVHEWTWSWRV